MKAMKFLFFVLFVSVLTTTLSAEEPSLNEVANSYLKLVREAVKTAKHVASLLCKTTLKEIGNYPPSKKDSEIKNSCEKMGAALKKFETASKELETAAENFSEKAARLTGGNVDKKKIKEEINIINDKLSSFLKEYTEVYNLSTRIHNRIHELKNKGRRG